MAKDNSGYVIAEIVLVTEINYLEAQETGVGDLARLFVSCLTL